MYLQRKDIDKITEILKQFPNVQVFDVQSENHSGIGSTTTMRFECEVNGVKGEFEVEISGVEDW